MTIERLKKIKLEYSEIIEASMERGEFDEFCGLPEFVRVVIKSSAGSGSLIMTELWLPTDWNGVFTGLGNGGMAGGIPRYALADRVRGAYAAACTDMGTSRGRDSGIANPDVWQDFGHRATHIMTADAKKIIFEYYGRAAEFSYFIGASTGGQQAFLLAQRYPYDYDGIIAGVPANNRTNLHAYFLWNFIHLHDKDKKPMFTAAEVPQITRLAVEFRQACGDGEKGDNFISTPYENADTITDFLKYLSDNTDFSAEQLAALAAVYDGPKNPISGSRIYNGMPIGAEKFGCGILDCQGEESPHFYPFIWAFGKDYDGYSFNFGTDMQRLNSLLAADLNANNADLQAFSDMGGKMIVYSGSADPCVPYPDAANCCKRICDKMGGYAKASEFFRYFLIPGSDHGSNGDGANRIYTEQGAKKDILHALREWREHGKAPDWLCAAREDENGNTVFERRVYPLGSEKNPFGKCPPCCDEIYLLGKDN